jgi:hypothetical protein
MSVQNNVNATVFREFLKRLIAGWAGVDTHSNQSCQDQGANQGKTGEECPTRHAQIAKAARSGDWLPGNTDLRLHNSIKFYFRLV